MLFENTVFQTGAVSFEIDWLFSTYRNEWFNKEEIPISCTVCKSDRIFSTVKSLISWFSSIFLLKKLFATTFRWWIFEKCSQNLSFFFTFRDFCPQPVTRTVTCKVKNGTETFTKMVPRLCKRNWPSSQASSSSSSSTSSVSGVPQHVNCGMEPRWTPFSFYHFSYTL